MRYASLSSIPKKVGKAGRLAFLAACTLCLSGCILSDRPLMGPQDSVQPFGDYVLFEQLRENSQTHELERAGRLVFQREGAWYRIKSIDTGGLPALDGATFLLYPVGRNEGVRYFALQMKQQGSQPNDAPTWLYFLVQEDLTDGRVILRTYGRTFDCDKIPDNLVVALRPRAVIMQGCAVDSIDGLVQLFRADISQHVLQDSSGFVLHKLS